MNAAAATIAPETLAIAVENADNELPSTCLDSGNAVFESLYAEFDPEARTVTFGEDHPSVNGVPFKVYHGRVVRFAAPEGVDTEQLGDLFRSDEIQAWLVGLADAYECKWDGNNHVGSYVDNERAAHVIQWIRDDVEQLEPAWTCSRFDEWVTPAKASILAELGGDASRIPALVEKIEAEARAEQNGILVGDGEKLLRIWLDEASEDE